MAAEETFPTTLPDGYERRQEGNAFLVVRKEYAEGVIRALSPLYQAWARIAQRRFTARGRAGVASFSLDGGLQPIMVRRYFHGGFFASIGKDLYWGPGRALTELRVAEAARAGGVRTPLPVGILAQPAAGPFWRMAFLSAEISNSEDLIHYCVRLGEYPAETAAIEKRGVIREAATQIRLMHNLGIFHADLHLKNLLLRRRVSEPPEVFVIDFDRATIQPALDADRRLANLKRLARSVRKVRVADAILTTWDRLRFLRDYLQGHPDQRRLMRLWARKIASSGKAHQVWWTMSPAQRSLRGDRVGRVASLKRSRR